MTDPRGAAEDAFASPWWVVAVLAVATAVRVVYLVELAATPWWDHLVVDPQYYDAWAREIAAGDWLGRGAFYMDPLYPYLLGAVYRLVGPNLVVARLVNVACSVGACGLTVLLGRTVGGPRIGLLAGLGLALYEPDVFNVGELDKTALSMLLVAGVLWLHLAARGRRGWLVAAGVALGLGVLTRANLLVMAPAGALLVLVDRGGSADARRRRGDAVAFVLGVALALAPVAVRNYAVSGAFVLTTTQLGQNFYTGNNPTNPYGAYGVVPFVRANPNFEESDFRAEAEARAGRPLGPNEVSWFWLRAGLAHVVSDPSFALRAFGRKAALFWNDFEISDSQDQYTLERDAAVLRLPLLGFGEVAALACLGALVTARRRWQVRRLLGFVALYWGTLVAFFLFARYRIQVVPALLPVAALGLTEVSRCVQARDVRRIAVAAIVLAATGWFSFHTIGIFDPDHPNVFEMRMRHLADVHLAAGDPDRAIAALAEAIPRCPHGCPWALADLFAVYRRSGRAAEGARWFERFVRDHPEQRDAPGYLAVLRGDASPP